MEFRYLVIPDDIDEIKDKVTEEKDRRAKAWNATKELEQKVGADSSLVSQGSGALVAFAFKDKPDSKYWKVPPRMSRDKEGRFVRIPKLNTKWGKLVDGEMSKINRMGALLDKTGDLLLGALDLNVLIPGKDDRSRTGMSLFCSSCAHWPDKHIFLARIPVSEEEDSPTNRSAKGIHPRCIELKKSQWIALTEEGLSLSAVLGELPDPEEAEE